MNTGSGISFTTLIFEASPVVQLVLLLLVAASIWSWAIIVRKLREFKKAEREANRFEDQFWSGGNLNELYRELEPMPNRGTAAIFVAGFREFFRLRKQSGMAPKDALEGSNRAMRVALNRELDQLEFHLSFLATVGSTSPYIGLLGTVWGIMNAFSAIGATSNATLAMVAPGISEALVATAIGLFAAIPGVIFFNRFSNEVDQLNNRYDIFLEEFSAILRHQSHARQGGE